MNNKTYFKLQEFVAHASTINCVHFGRKSGQVFATGGDDKCVNLWRIGKPNNIMSLTGHQSSIESIVFDSQEKKVIAGSQGGSIKCFDLDGEKTIRTFKGHMSVCNCLDYHPFGEYFASGSLDTNIKIWDHRTKSSIQTYKGHKGPLKAVKFSPDGRWVTSGGEDGCVKIWDLTAGKLLKDFNKHDGPISCLEFNPNEFILVTSSTDKSIRIWDLENFELIGTTPTETSFTKCISHTVDSAHLGKLICSSTKDYVKIWSWDPTIECHDTLDVSWGNVTDTIICENMQLISASTHATFVSIHIINLDTLRPFSNGTQASGQTKQMNNNSSGSHNRPASSSNSNLHVRPTSSHDKQINSSKRAVTPQQPIPVNENDLKNVRMPPPIVGEPWKIPPKQERISDTDLAEMIKSFHLQERPQEDLVANIDQIKEDPVKTYQNPLVFAFDQLKVEPDDSEQENKPDIVEIKTEETSLTIPTELSHYDSTNKIKVAEIKKLCQDVNHQNVITNLQKRVLYYKELNATWNATNSITEIIKIMNNVEVRYRSGVINDFIRKVVFSDYLNLDYCCCLLPLIVEVLSSSITSNSYLEYFSCGVECAERLFMTFSPLIKNVRTQASLNLRDVDLSGEERLKKCELCYIQFEEIEKEVTQLRKNKKNISLYDLLDRYLTVIKKK